MFSNPMKDAVEMIKSLRKSEKELYWQVPAGQFLPEKVVHELTANPVGILAMNEEPTYDGAIKLVKQLFNLTQLGCLYYNVDYDTASASDKENARSKMKSRLKKPNSKTIVRLNEVLFPFIMLLSDQQVKKLSELQEKSK